MGGAGNPLAYYEVHIIGHGVAGEVEGLLLSFKAQGDLMTTVYTGQILDPRPRSSPGKNGTLKPGPPWPACAGKKFRQGARL